MSLHSELDNVKIEHDCSQCIYNCGVDCPCDRFVPKNMATFLNNVVNTLVKTAEPGKGKKMRMPEYASDNLYTRLMTSVKRHYVMIINDAISEIRKGRKAYLYCLEELRDVISYEPSVMVRYVPDFLAYELWLEK